MEIEEANRILEQDHRHKIGVYGIEPVDKDLLKEAKKVLLNRILNDLEKEDGIIGVEPRHKNVIKPEPQIGLAGLILAFSILLTAYTVFLIITEYRKTLLIYLPLCISHLITWWYLFDLERKNLKS